MTLLREIQDAAVDSDIELATLLRKCKILAARLGNAEFKQWVDYELNGYNNSDCLPDYRKLKVNSKGHFSGPFQTGLRNANIPLMCIPEKFREHLTHSYVKQPIAAMQTLVENAKGGNLQEPWDPDLVVVVGEDIYEGMNCMQAWKVIPINAIVAALDAVRNRILSFVLEIETEAPDAGEAPINSSPLPQERVQQIFNTFITGNVQNVSTGGHGVKQQATNIESSAEVFEELLKAVQSIDNTELKSQLTSIVKDMQASRDAQGFKVHYQNFMSILADHMQVLGPVVAPYLPTLAALVSQGAT